MATAPRFTEASPPAALPSGTRGARVLRSNHRASTPSVYTADAAWSLAQSVAGNLDTAWVAFVDVSETAKTGIISQWIKAARQLGCGLSKNVDVHADGSVDLAFRCQPVRPQQAKTDTE